VIETASQPLADAKREATVKHVLTATRRWVLANGLEATMEELAGAAGVSRRTVFRLFGTRDELLVAAFSAGMAEYQSELPGYDGDLNSWLRATCDATHRMNTAVGPGFWELTSRLDLPPGLAETEIRRRRKFRETMGAISRVLWRSHSGKDDPPDELLTAVSAHLSPHFTAAVETDVGRGWEVASHLAFEAIVLTLERLT
jgi:AcrR family transcriptional regulator